MRVCAVRSIFFAVLLLLPLAGVSSAQAPAGIIRGTVIDPSGAAVTDATITITPVNGGLQKTTTTNRLGAYEISGVAPGSYNISVTAKGFALFVKQNVQVTGGQVQSLDFSLVLEEQKEQVTVQDQGTTVDVSPTANASALVLKGADLDALSDDPDELQSELSALAGPSAGPNGGQFYVDGFTAGQLPPKSSIREIRINQNPFSAEYDKLGYGRIEIFTKPGTNQFHGQFMVDGNDLPFDARNPFATQLPGYNTFLTNDDVSGPLSKKASFTFDFQHRNINNTGVVNAVTLDPTFNETPFSQAISNPMTRTVISPRIDYQLSKNNTLTVRYQYWHDAKNNSGIGQFTLPTAGYNTSTTEDTVQVSDTQVISANVINETRFQYLHDASSQLPLSLLPQISVIGAFTGGGSNQGSVIDNQNHYELQNYTSMALGKHFFTFGGRLRALTERNSSTGNFNGTYTFSSLNTYRTAQLDLASGIALPAGVGPTQFSLMTGTPAVNINLVDLGVYAQDDWRVRPNLTLSYGLRFETQNDISDHADWAPRLAVSWGINRNKNSAPRTVIRAGSGMFYDRFTNNLVLEAAQENGIVQTEYILPEPSFYPTIPNPATLANSQVYSTVYRVDSNLRAPYTIQSAASIEQQVTKRATVSLTYLNSRGLHQLLTDNINAPLPGYYNPLNPVEGRPLDTLAGQPLVPNGNTIGNVYEYESVGQFRQNELIANFNVSMGAKVSLFGFYSLNYADSDTGGPSTFPSNPYNIAEDYGRATFAIRDRLFIGGSILMPYGFRLSPFAVFQSGTPFNITLGQDLNGTTIFNQRPAFANASTPAQDVVNTQYGSFNIAPTPGEPLIPINYGTGPSAFVMNLRVSKTFGLGKKTGEHAAGGPRGGGGGGGGPRGGGLGGRGLTGPGGRNPFNAGTVNTRYTLTLSANGRNIFNNINLATPVGNLTSPLFGRSNGLAGGMFSFGGATRLIDLQATFSF